MPGSASLDPRPPSAGHEPESPAVPMIDLRPQLQITEPEWRRYVREVLESGQFILGRQVAAFEQELAAGFHAPHAIGVGSGTDALEISLRCAGVQETGQEVLTSALTSPYTALAILAAGAKPRFADVDPATLLLDCDDAAQRVNGKTAAIVPVHLYGQSCDLDRLASLAVKAGALMIQDACQAHGAQRDGRPFTEFSSYVAYSFYPTKNLGCLGDGGAVLTGDPEVAERLRSLRDGGRRGDQISWTPGINSRLDEMQACYLRAFLPHLDEWNAARRRLAALYDSLLEGCEPVSRPARDPESVCHLYVIRTAQRDALREHLARRGIATGVHYPAPLHLHPAFADCGLRAGDLPHAERACREVLSLPLWPYLAEQAVERVARAVRDFWR